MKLLLAEYWFKFLLSMNRWATLEIDDRCCYYDRENEEK